MTEVHFVINLKKAIDNVEVIEAWDGPTEVGDTPEIKEKQEINKLILDREQFRKEKQFEQADKIRDKLNEMNVELIDHKGKTIWMRKENIKAEDG